MEGSIEHRLFKRELGNSTSSYSKVKGIYGSKSFVRDLDIVNELDGHNGCVNALSWSKNGRLLASGSDDRVINIHSYLHDQAASHFDLVTQIDTGHSRNIFSVKFMPHSNDRQLVSAAGDSQIRVFDIERAAATNSGRLRFSQSQANCKVFRSHSGAVKRIVTEASPFYFLSCSEDGDVRQWDIRQPESAYPRTGSRLYGSRNGRTRSNAPPPLISYADYNIDLMTISCSATQPHYIAVGGRALHCFLHDRRMLGRDKFRERGASASNEDDIATATRCVRKFAPYGQPNMRRSDPKTITACKISDSNPNKLIASWSGDLIYGFDIVREDEELKRKSKTGIFNRKDKKRKRKDVSAGDPSRSGERSSELRTQRGDGNTNNVAVLIQMGDQSVEIPLPRRAFQDSQLARIRSRSHSQGETIAEQVRHLRNSLLDLAGPGISNPDPGADDAVSARNSLDDVLASALKLIEKLDKLVSEWRYPVDPTRTEIAFQQKLREDRAKVWRFVQACGTVARVASRKTGSALPNRLYQYFDVIRPAPREASMPLEKHEQFGYDFIKAILLWLDSGVGAVLREFTQEPDHPDRSYRRRRPITLDGGVDSLDLELIPYLRRLASATPVDESDSDSDGDNYIFRTEVDAVNALSRAMQIPFADLSDSAAERNEAGQVLTQDRETAVRFWGFRVCRAMLRNAAIEVNRNLVATAFGERVAAGNEEPLSAEMSTTGNDELQEGEAEDGEGDWNVEPSSGADSNAGADVQHELEESDEMDVDDDSEEDTDILSESDPDDYDEGPEFFLLGRSARGPRSKQTAAKHVPCTTHTQVYRGHCNVETVKDVGFFGLEDEWVVSGSDCGNFFIWERDTGKLVNILEGDTEVVNVVQGHPYEPMLAVSGIDSTVKIFGVDARARKEAAMGMGIASVDPSTFSSIGLRSRRERRRAREAETEALIASESAVPESVYDLPELPYEPVRLDENGEAIPTARSRFRFALSEPAEPRQGMRFVEEDDEAEPPWYERESTIRAKGGLRSRRRIQDEYQICSRNDMDRRRGGEEGSLSQGAILALLAQHMRFRFPEMMEEDAGA